MSLTESYNKNLNNWVSSFKRYTSKLPKERLNISPVWQKNYYEHVVRNDESVENIAEYILNNPVRRNLVADWEDYPHSKLYCE
jgi:REP element-mobilizing transposase RayT